LVTHFAKTFSQRMGKPIRQIPPETLEAFTLYSWPGNVRELQNLIERAVIRSNDGVLPNPLSAVENNPVTLSPKQGTLTDSTLAAILQALRATNWVIGGPRGAAARLGLKRTTLLAQMKKLGLSRPGSISNGSQFGEDDRELVM
jgi:transcriptional regulator with GAF, ATPase, and Fis domain